MPLTGNREQEQGVEKGLRLWGLAHRERGKGKKTKKVSQPDRELQHKLLRGNPALVKKTTDRQRGSAGCVYAHPHPTLLKGSESDLRWVPDARLSV